MKRIELKRRALEMGYFKPKRVSAANAGNTPGWAKRPSDDPKARRLSGRFKFAQECDFSELMKESFVAYEGGVQRIAYKVLDWDTSDIVSALHGVEYATADRVNGMLSNSAIFGYMPKRLPYQDFCRATSMASRAPAEHEVICRYGAKVAEEYRALCPEDFERHEGLVKDVSPTWKLEGTPFTSGIVNKDNQLPYHFDSGNFKSAKSCMLTFKHLVKGGYLSIPEYDIGVEVANNSLLIFDGAIALHGVTPIHKEETISYRFSVVYYSLQQMWKCMTPEEELARVRKKKTEREMRRGGLIQ